MRSTRRLDYALDDIYIIHVQVSITNLQKDALLNTALNIYIKLESKRLPEVIQLKIQLRQVKLLTSLVDLYIRKHGPLRIQKKRQKKTSCYLWN